MKLRSVHYRLEVLQDNKEGEMIKTFLKVNQCLEITDNARLKIGGKTICLISKGD